MTTQDEKRDASAKIAELIKEAEEKLAEAVKIAEGADVDFRYDGPTYGMGGHYTPESWSESSEYYEEDVGWQASSAQDC